MELVVWAELVEETAELVVEGTEELVEAAEVVVTAVLAEDEVEMLLSVLVGTADDDVVVTGGLGHSRMFSPQAPPHFRASATTS